MNRSRPRRPGPRRGRSREASPARQEEEKLQGLAAEETYTEPLPRRSTRNRRGSPTPPPAAVPSIDENDTAANAGSSKSQAQHAKIKEEAIKASDGDTISNDSEARTSETAEQGDQGTKGAQRKPLVTDSANDGNKSKDVPSHQASSPNLEGNGEAPSQGIPTLSQEIDAFKGNNGARLAQSKVKQTGSKRSNGPGDDHATEGNTDSGKKESSVGEQQRSGEAKVTIGEASAPLDNERTLTATNTDGEATISSPREASDQESRTISLGSKSTLDFVDAEGNDQEEKVTTSPQVPFNDVPEKAMPLHEKEISLSSDIRNKARNVSAYDKGGDEKNEAGTTNAATKKDGAPTTSGPKLRTQDCVSRLSATDNASHPEVSLPAPKLPNEIHTDSTKPTNSLLSEIENGPGTLPLTDTAKSEATKLIEKGSENDASHTMSVSKDVPREPNNANPVLADDKKHQPSMPRRESSASNPAVFSDAFAIDIRPTAKGLSKARGSHGGPNATSSSAKTGKDCSIQVKGDAVLSDSRKRTLANDSIGIQPSDEAHSTPKRQRRETPSGILSNPVLQDSTPHVKARRRRRRRSRTISRQDQGDLVSALTDVENVKLQLYDIASRVHRGKGPERQFAAYWEALRLFLMFQVHQGPSSISRSLDGVHNVLNSFLVTKQMRKLHNLLVKGLLSQCVKESIEEKGIREAVPGEWGARMQNNRDKDLPVPKDLDLAFDLGDFGVHSDLWTGAGREPLRAHCSVAASEETDHSRISDREVIQLHRHEPRLPGALAIDPLVRGIVREESSLKVSENAIWLLIVATRQYTETVARNTVSNMESIQCEHSLEPIEFAPRAARSGTSKTPKSASTRSIGDKNDSGTKKPSSRNPKKPPTTPEKKASWGEKRRRVTPLDIAAALNGSRLSQGGQSFAGSVSSLASMRCYQSSFDGSQTTVPPSLDSVQSFLVERIETTTKRPRHEWRDPEAVPVAPKPRKQSPQKKSSSTPKPGGLRQEPRKVTAFAVQGGGTVKATTPARPLAPVARHEARPAATMPVPSPGIPKTPPASSVPKDRNAAVPPPPPPPVGVRGSPPSASPRGRGRGFGVKDLAAMRARSGSTPPKQVSTSPAPGRESNSPSSATQPRTPTMQQQNGAGKELRRLQQVQGGEPNDSIAAASSGNAMPGMLPVVPVAGQPDSMDTTQ